ncbi:MAG TPA: PaaI family thioesterase [Dehalococcoidia bacterium]|nr:PaaI family thioesterase [Dehalococcoidia bacterium]
MRADITEIVAGRAPLPNCAVSLGGKAVEARDGYFKATFDAREEFYNLGNVVQGGFLAAMLDDTLGPAVITTMNEDEVHSTVDLHVQYLRPATAGQLTGEARVTHRGKTVRMAEATLSTADGKIIARASCSCVIRQLSGS